MIALVVGCAAAPRDPADRPPPDETGSPAETPTSDGEPAPLDLAVVTWSATFGWDDGPTEVETPLGPVAPEIVVTLGDATWADVGFDPSRADRYCQIALPLEDAGPAAWTGDDARLWHGLDAGPPSRSTCPDDALSDAAWGVAVGELSASAAAFTTYAFRPSDRRSIFGGRVLAGDVLPVDDEVYGRAWALDADGALRTDATGASTALDAGDLFAGGALARGWYRLESMYVWPLDE